MFLEPQTVEGLGRMLSMGPVFQLSFQGSTAYKTCNCYIILLPDNFPVKKVYKFLYKSHVRVKQDYIKFEIIVKHN